MHLDELDTPIPVVDLDRMHRNLDRAADYATRHGIALRPHIKTHKSPVVAGEQLSRGAAGLTCATLHEVEVMSEVTDDLMLAYPPVGAPRLARLAALPATVRPRVALDSIATLEALASACAAVGRTVDVLVELDVGMRRVGTPSDEDAIAIAHRASDLPGVRWRGVTFYPGHIRDQVTEQDAALAALGDRLTSALHAFSRAGLTPEVVSGGSTPTMWRTHELPGVNEHRPGTYVYNDRTTAAIGACAWEDCALTVLATVVSTAVSGQAVIDAGSKALGREPLRGADGEGFGALLDRPDVTVRAMSEEHGILDLGASGWRPTVGERVRVVPNHVCIVVHLADIIAGMRGDDVVTSWPVAARGRGVRLSLAPVSE